MDIENLIAPVLKGLNYIFSDVAVQDRNSAFKVLNFNLEVTPFCFINDFFERDCTYSKDISQFVSRI